MVNRKRLRRLMEAVPWRTLYPERRATLSDHKARKYPYLLGNMQVERSIISTSLNNYQFTSDCYIELLKTKGIKISMDGRGRALDNVFIERLWISVKQEYVYLNPCETRKELWRVLNDYFRFYNTLRPHHSIDDLTPANLYKSYEKAA